MLVRLLLVVLFVATPLGAAPIPKELRKKSPKELIVGRWKLVKSELPIAENHELFIDFTKDGKITLTNTYGQGQPDIIYKGTYQLDPETMKMPWDTIREGFPTIRKGETSTIPTLDEQNLILIDPEGIKEVFIRVKQ